MAPAIAEWTRVLGKSLIVSTTEDDDTAAANCAVEVVMAVDGAVRGKVTYTLPAQTVLSIASAGEEESDGVEQDPIPAINAFFKPIATRAREMLQSSGLGCAVAIGRVNDVRGHSYASPVASPYSVHMVTQPSHKDPSSPQPVSLWFDLEVTALPTPVPQPVGAQRMETPRAAVREEAVPEPPRPATQQNAPRTPESRQTGVSAPSGGAGRASPDNNPRDRAPGYTSVVRTGRLEIVDEGGTARAVISTLADGSPHIVFADRDGRIRAAISLAKDGQPRILFLDEMGRRILDLPHAGPSSQNSNPQPPSAGQQPIRRPGPSAPQNPAPRQPGQQPPQGNGRPEGPPPKRP